MGPLAGKSILIKDITDDTSFEEFIEKVRDGFNLKNLIISLYFPTDFIIIASLCNSVYYKSENNNLSIYSLCCEGNKSIGMIIITSLEEASFNIKINVNNEHNIILNNVKGSVSVDNLIEMIKKETNMKNDYNYVKVEGRPYDKKKNIVDIISDNNIEDILNCESLINYSLSWKLKLTNDCDLSLPNVVFITLNVSTSTDSKYITVPKDGKVSYLMDEARKVFGCEGNMVLSFGGKTLNSYRTLSSYNISKYLPIRLAYDVPGGGNSFVNVSRIDSLIDRIFSHEAPDWRICTNGANVEGKCINK